MVRSGGCLKVGSRARKMASGGERQTGGLGRAEPCTGVEGLSGSKTKDAGIFSMIHPVFLLFLFIAQLQMSLGNTSLTGN